MNNHVDAIKAKVQDKYVIGLLIGTFVISFFLWMEYKAYQIRSAMETAFSGIGKAFKDMWTSTDISKGREEKKDIEVAKWNSFTNDKWIKVSVRSVENIGKEFSQNEYSKKVAKNSFYKITMQGENTWKEPGAQSLYNVSLILADWTKYNGEDEQILKNRPEWFDGCISCSMNPGDKSVHAILFDINVPNIDGAKLKIDNVLFNL